MLVKVTSVRQSIQEWAKFDRLYHFKFFKGCLQQIVPGSLLDTLPHTAKILGDSNAITRGIPRVTKCLLGWISFFFSFF